MGTHPGNTENNQSHPGYTNEPGKDGNLTHPGYMDNNQRNQDPPIDLFDEDTVEPIKEKKEDPMKFFEDDTTDPINVYGDDTTDPVNLYDDDMTEPSLPMEHFGDGNLTHPGYQDLSLDTNRQQGSATRGPET